MQPPELRTRRLQLRAPRPDDRNAIYAYARDPGVSRHLPWNAHRSPADTDAYLQKLVREADEGHQTWVIEMQATRRVIGTFSLRPHQPARDEATLGFAISREHWGQGYGTEAGKAVVERARGLPGINRVVATVWPGNERSRRLLQRLGLKQERREKRPGRETHGDAEVLVYARKL